MHEAINSFTSTARFLLFHSLIMIMSIQFFSSCSKKSLNWHIINGPRCHSYLPIHSQTSVKKFLSETGGLIVVMWAFEDFLSDELLTHRLNPPTGKPRVFDRDCLLKLISSVFDGPDSHLLPSLIYYITHIHCNPDTQVVTRRIVFNNVRIY